METAAKRSGPHGKRGRGCCLCFGIAMIVVAVVGVTGLILGLTVFKPKPPVTAVDSVSLKDLRASVDVPKLAVRLNVTLDLGLSLKNPNRVGFVHSNATAFLLYKGGVVGEAPIPAGEIAARSTTPLNLTLTLLADRLLSQPGVYSGIASSGDLPLTTSTTVPGKVAVLKVFKFRVVSRTTCDLTVQVFNRTVAQTHCNHHTKL